MVETGCAARIPNARLGTKLYYAWLIEKPSHSLERTQRFRKGLASAHDRFCAYDIKSFKHCVLDRNQPGEA